MAELVGDLLLRLDRWWGISPYFTNRSAEVCADLKQHGKISCKLMLNKSLRVDETKQEDSPTIIANISTGGPSYFKGRQPQTHQARPPESHTDQNYHKETDE